MAERIEGLDIGLKLDTLQVENGLTGLKRELKSANAEMKNHLSAFDYGEKSVDKFEAKLKGMNRQLETQQRVTDESEKKYHDMVEQYGEGSRQAQNAEREYQNQSAALQNLNRRIQNTTAEMEEFKKQQEIANSGWTKTGEKLESTGDKITNVGSKVGGFGRKWTKVTGIIAGAVTGAGVAVFGLTSKVAKSADEIQDNADKAGMGAESYQEWKYWAEQNGIEQASFDKLLQRSNQRISEARQGNEKYTEALQDMGFSQEEINNMDTADMYEEIIQKLQGMDDTSEATALATEFFGKKTARELLPALEDGATQFDEAKKEAHEYGVILSDDQLEASQDFVQSQKTIKAALGGIAAQIGMELMPYFADMQNWIQAHMPEIKETITSTFDTVSSSVKSVVSWFMNLSSTTKKTIGVFAGVAAALGPVAIVFGKVMQGVGPLVSGIGKLSLKVGKLGGLLPALKAAFAALTGPVGLTVAAIAGLTAGFVTAYNKSETFRNAIQTIGQKIMEFGQTVKPYIMQALGAVVDFMKDIGNQLKQFWDENKETITQALQNIMSVVKTVFNTIKSIIETVMPVVLSIIKSVWGNIKGVIQGTLDVIMGVVKTFSGLLTGDFSKMWEGIKQIFTGAIKAVWNFIQLQLFGRILKAVKPFASTFKKIFSTLWNGIKTIFKTTITAIFNFVKKWFTKTKNTIKTIFDAIKGFFSSIWSGIKKVFTTVIKSIFNFAKQWWSKFKNVTKNIFNSVKGFISSVWSGIKKVFTTVITSVVNFAKQWWGKFKYIVKSTFNSIKKFFSTIWNGIKGIFTSVIKSIINFVKKRFNSMKNTITTIWEGIKKITKSAWNGVKKFIINPVKSGVKWALDKFTSFKNSVSKLFGNIKDGVSNKVSDMIQFIKDMPGKMKKAIVNGGGKIKSGFLSIAAKMVDGIYAGVNGIIDGVNWAWNKLGGKKNKFGHLSPSAKWYKNAKAHAHGTDSHPGGLAKVNDGKGSNAGQELIQTPDGRTGMFKGKNVYANLPKGTSVLSAKATSQLPAYAWGTGALKKAWDSTSGAVKSGAKWTKDKSEKVGEKIGDAGHWVGKSAAKGAKSVMKQGLNAVGIQTPGKLNNAMGLVRRSFLSAKDAGIKKIKEKIQDMKEKYVTGMSGDLFGKNFKMTSDYGNRPNPMGGSTEFHKGVDFAADVGTPIEVVRPGKVIHAGVGGKGSGYSGYGKSVAIRTGKYDDLYGHMSKVYAKEGQDIKSGGHIGEVGQTGQATGPHVHYEIRKKGTLQTKDPNKVLGSSEPSGKGVNRWKPVVKKALRKNNLSTSKGMVDKVLRQIKTESMGNPKAIQGSGVNDINMAQGNPAKGLMQTIPQTFNAFKHKGHGNIMNGYDNLLASLAYAKDRYGNSLSALGKGHGYKKGTNFVPEDQPAFLHKGEAVVPKEYNQQPTQAMKLLAMVGKKLKGESESKIDLDNGSKIADKLDQIIEKLDNAGISQTNNYYDTGKLSPSESARKNKKMLQQFANGL